MISVRRMFRSVKSIIMDPTVATSMPLRRIVSPASMMLRIRSACPPFAKANTPRNVSAESPLSSARVTDFVSWSFNAFLLPYPACLNKVAALCSVDSL
jgi:hypothetical protein